MSENTTYPELSIHSAHALVESISGYTLKEEDFLDYAHTAMKSIGYNRMPIKLKADVGEEGVIDLPCDMDQIKGVSFNRNSFQQWPVAEYEDGVVMYDRIYAYDDPSRPNSDGMRTMVDYNFTPPTKVEVHSKYEDGIVFILGSMKIVDEEGDALINYKQSIAVARYCIWMHAEKRAFAGMPSPIPIGDLAQRALLAVADAKVPEQLSDNEMDKILNAKTSFGRKLPNSDFYPR
jgi:hypothetical protein